jgi:nucleotide-binding universal stress UspA family protein
MANPILVGYDVERGDRAPLEFGLAAASFTEAPLIVACVQGPAQSLDSVAYELRRDGIDVDVRPLAGPSAARALHEAAEEFGAALLVVGSTERGRIGRVLPGSTAERLMHGAPCPIAVVPRGWKRSDGLHTIGVGYIDTAEGHAALDDAIVLTRRSGARLRVLCAASGHGLNESYGGGDPMTPAVRYDEIAGGILLSAEQAIAAATSGVSGLEIEPDVSIGDAADFLIAASRQLDLLVCGSRGYGPAQAVLLGGVSRRVVTEAHCPVIVLARGAQSSLEALVDERAGAIG